MAQELNDLMNGPDIQRCIQDIRLAVDNTLEAFEFVGVDKLVQKIFDHDNPGEKDLLTDEVYKEAITSNQVSFIHNIYMRVMIGVYADLLPEQPITVFPAELARATQEVFASTFRDGEDDVHLIKQLKANTKALVEVHFGE